MLATLVLNSGGAAAPSPEDSVRLSLHLALGVGGQTALHSGDITLRADNNAWVGGGARLEKPAGDFLALGTVLF